MTQRKNRIFVDEICSKALKNENCTNKTVFHHIDDTFSLDILDVKDYGAENNRDNSYVLVATDNFSKLGWIVSLGKNAQTIKHSLENILSPPIENQSGRDGRWISICK